MATKQNDLNAGGGVKATKYHYSDQGSKRDVILWFNKDFDTLYYQG